MKALEETKEAAKAAGIKSYWLKSEENLQEELSNEEVTETVDSAETVVEEVELVEVEELVLPTDVSKKLMDFSIKCVGKKSPYYKYKDLL